MLMEVIKLATLFLSHPQGEFNFQNGEYEKGC